MKKTSYLNFRIPVLLFYFLVSFSFRGYSMPPAGQEYYEIKIYHLTQKAQEGVVDEFLKQVYLPALHRAGIAKVGVFKPIETDTAFGKLIYVFIPFKSMDQFLKLAQVLEKDKQYNEAGKSFLDADVKNPPFGRYESILSMAFSNMPQFKVPTFTTPNSERIYEYRSYESATEAKATKKIQMFNEGGEIAIFKSIGANPVFFAKVILGSQMPRLLYLTTYANMKSHDDCWTAFRNHPDWKKISGMEEYRNTTSKTSAFLLHPTSYSDF